MSSTEQFSPARSEARAEITHRLHQFCRAVDRMDLGALTEVFHPDAHDDHGSYKGDIPGFVDYLRERHQTVGYSAHHLGNVYVEFVSDDEAFVESYLLIWQSSTPDSTLFTGASGDGATFEFLSSARYVDRFTRRDGRWRIQNRTTVPGTSMRVDPAATMALVDGFAVYTRDENDPAERLRADMTTSLTSGEPTDGSL